MNNYKSKIMDIIEHEPSDDWESYLDAIYPHFDVDIEEKRVLEIGAFDGCHTAIIESYGPKSISIVESNANACFSLCDRFPNAEVINDDIFMYLEKPREFDIVVCCGVLYHLHSPLHLLELIVNRISPKLIILESVTGKSRLLNEPFDIARLSIEENENQPGQRFSIKEWKTAGLALLIQQSAIDYAMNSLGYTLVNECNLVGKTTHESKAGALLTVWERK